MEALQRLDIPHSRVNSLEDLLRDPHLNDVGFFVPNGLEQAGQERALRQPVRFHGLAELPDRPPPRLGGDAEEVLASLGYSAADIAELVAAGAVGRG
jgi:crotonobetainyl-CoA:carnitine CoA-transferase CaiB-like acyl-CoA transferase